MEISESRKLIDLNLRKIFDMKMKQGHEMKKAFVDETEFLRTFYFLKGSRVYEIEMSSKKLEELEFTKGKEVVYLGSNINNEYLIIITKDGKIYAIDNQHNVKYVKNMLATSLLLDKTKEINFSFLKLAASAKLDKIVLANENVMAIWYQNEICSNTSVKFIKKSQVQELNGTFYNISLENEKKTNIPPAVLANKSYCECIAPVFNNNYFLGCYGRISYLLMYYEVNSYKLILIDYLFKYDTVHKFRAIDFNSTSVYDEHLVPEHLKSIEKKVMYSYLQKTKEHLNFFNNKERIIMKYNKYGNMCAILINFTTPNNTSLTLFMSETSRFISTNIYNLLSTVKYPLIKDDKSSIFVEDIEWICNDLFIVILLSCGYFVIINTNFQIINFMDTSNNSHSPSNNDNILIPNYYNTLKLKISDKLNLISSKKRADYFLIYSTNYSICYQVNFKNFENKIFNNNFNFSFDDFLYEFKYFQIYNNPLDVESNSLFDKIHNYFVKCLKDLYDPTALTTVVNDSVNSLFSTFVKFLRIFRQINQIHETNLTVLSYLIGISNDFFIHLLNCKEIWLGFLFLNICENYLLKHLKIKSRGNKLCSESIKKGQITYVIVNPYYQPNISLKCYNKVRNRVIHSRLRLLLIFFALIEFRNNQALNINVLYFILAKRAIEKMKKHNLLDDIQMIVKVIIRNWKFLKNENTRAGCEEYILNGLSMNYRTELLAPFIHTRSVRDDIKFDFFNDFYPLEELHSFTELNEIYCRGEEESLINEYSYVNNVGVVQKWILYYMNFFYVYLFDDIRTYMDNQLRQNSNKNPEQISPDEKNLASIIYFNVNFFFMCITNQIQFFLKFMTNKTEHYNELYLSADDPKLLEEFVKINFPFISPVDVPFLIFEFYITEDNKAKKNLPYEIISNLGKMIQVYTKNYNFSLNEMLDFIEFLISRGFKHSSDEKDYDVDEIDDDLTKANRMQQFIYSALLFYFYSIHKFGLTLLLETEQSLIFSAMNNLNQKMKKDLYEFIYIILNGHLRFYLKKETTSKLNPNQSKHLECILAFLKTLFYKILREEPFEVRRNIAEYVSITPSVMRSYLLEGAVYYEYKNFNKLLKANLFNSEDVLNIRNCTNINKVNITKFFKEITHETKQHPAINIILSNSKDKSNVNYSHYRTSIVNLLGLLQSSDKTISSKDKLLFNIEPNREYIRKLVVGATQNKEEIDERFFNNIIIGIIDKIFKGNFDNRSEFKFTNNEIKQKLIRSIKVVIAKFIHMLTALFIKIKVIGSNPQINILEYLKRITYCFIFEKQSKAVQDNSIKIIDYLSTLSFKDLKNNTDKTNLIEALKNLHIIFLKNGKNLSALPKMFELDEKLKFENQDIHSQLRLFMADDLLQIKNIIDKVGVLKSANLKNFLICSFSDYYMDNLLEVYNQIEDFAISSLKQVNLKYTRQNYSNISEAFFNLTGVPTQSFIEFNLNWDLVTNELLYNYITTDETGDDKFKGDEDKKDSKHNLIMNRRQKYGSDTPKRRNIIPSINNYVEDKSLKTDNLKETRKLTRMDSNRSIDVREEKEIIPKPERLKIRNKKKNNLPKYKPNNSLTNMNDTLLSDNKSTNTIIQTKPYEEGSREDKNSLKLTESEEDRKDSNGQVTIHELVKSITRVFFNRLKTNMFLMYKKETTAKELEEVKIYSVKPQEGKVDILVLKERYLSTKGKIPQEAQEGLINTNSLNQSLNENGVKKTIRTQNTNTNNSNIKAFDLININKFKSGNGENSKLYKEVLKIKKVNKIPETIKTRLDEIKEKLNKYETMVQNLGKEFMSTIKK